VSVRERADVRRGLWPLSGFLFAAGVVPFVALALVVESGLRAAELAVRFTLLFCGASTLAGLIVGLVGSLPGNPKRTLAVGAAVFNAAALVFMLKRFALWGIW
jgi:hypothetical protein